MTRTNPIINIPEGLPFVSIKWENGDGSVWRETRRPGADLTDLPAEMASAIEEHWSDEIVAAVWHGILDQRAAEPVVLPPLTPFKFRLMLAEVGIDEYEVADFIDAIVSVEERNAVALFWEYSLTFERTSPYVQKILTATGLTDGAQVDALWSYALSFSG